MKRKKYLTNRVIVAAVGFLIQLFWIIFPMLKLGEYSGWINGGLKILSLLIVLYIIRKDENSAYKIAWIILIVSLPLFGGILYLFFGDKNPSKKMRRRLDAEHLQMEREFQDDGTTLDEMRQQMPGRPESAPI